MFRSLAYTQHCGENPGQQDALLAAGKVLQRKNCSVTTVAISPDQGLCAVADGVASSPQPHRASKTVLESLAAGHSIPDGLRQQGWVAPKVVRQHLHFHLCKKLERRSTHHSATTLAMLEWREQRFSVVNVGDSRVYRIAANATWTQLSKDHTYYQGMVDAGEIPAGQEVGRMYHDLEHMLIADSASDDFAVHWQTGELAQGDTMLLCTDGVHDVLGEKLFHLYQADRSITEQASIYRKVVLALGAPDNFSLILLR